MEKWYSCYWVQFEALLKKWKENSNILFTKYYNECARRIGFKFYKKSNEVWKLWDLSGYHDIIHGGCDKKLSRFLKSCHVRCLQNEAFSKKFHRVENDSLRFWVPVTVKQGFHFKIFYISNKHHGMFHVKCGYFFNSFDNFYFLTSFV